MGKKQSKQIHVLVISRVPAGKTHFLATLAYGVNTTTWPTVGEYVEDTAYKETHIRLRELGSGIGARRDTFLQGKRVDIIYFFVDESETFLNLLLTRNLLLTLLMAYPGKPLCIVYNVKDETLNEFDMERFNEVLQLEMISRSRPVYATVANNVEYILNWTVTNV